MLGQQTTAVARLRRGFAADRPNPQILVARGIVQRLLKPPSILGVQTTPQFVAGGAIVLRFAAGTARWLTAEI